MLNQSLGFLPRSRRTFLWCLVGLASLTPIHGQAGLEGAWEILTYEVGGSAVPVAGTMLFSNGFFSSVYRLGEAPESVRGHSGEYQIFRDQLYFHIPWWVEYVEGQGRVFEKEQEAEAHWAMEGEELVLRFASGSIQTLRRQASVLHPQLDGTWRLIDYESGSRTGLTTGLAIFRDGYFSLVYSMQRPDGKLDGRAHAGRFSSTAPDGLALEVKSSLHWIAGKSSVGQGVARRPTRYQVQDSLLIWSLGNDSRQRLVRTDTSLRQWRTAADLHTADDPRGLPVPPSQVDGPTLFLTGATLLDGSGGSPIEKAGVLIAGDQIVAVGPVAEVRPNPPADREIALDGLFITPGLIDLHFHFTAARSDDGGYRDSDAAAAIRGVEKLGLLLDGGITTIRETGTYNDVALRLKEAVERGIFDGPRVFWSGQILTTRGGHGDEVTSTGSGRPKSLAGSPRYRVATGPEDWRLAVREQIRQHADFIKMAAPFASEEVAAAVDEAHDLGFKLTVDAFGKYVTEAVKAGIDCIEHPLDISPETVALMAERRTALVPTLTTFYNVVTQGYPSAGIPKGGFYYTLSRRFVVRHEDHIRTVRNAHRMGVRVGVGTDFPFRTEEQIPAVYFEELGFLEDAGFSNSAILQAATRVGAEILGIADRLGTIAPGKLADLLVLAGNPLESIENLKSTRMVIADGRIVRDLR